VSLEKNKIGQLREKIFGKRDESADFMHKDLKLSDLKPELFLQLAISLYVIVMLFIFPFCSHKYLLTIKTRYYLLFNNGLIPLIILLLLIVFIKKYLLHIKDFLKTINITDAFVIAYWLVLLISAGFSEYPEYAWAGSYDWKVGFMAQTAWIVAYFAISRYFEYIGAIKYFFIIANSFEFIIAILNRFNIDVTGMFSGYDPEVLMDMTFLSTLGQPSWYSLYLCMVLPVGIYCYYKYDQWYNRLIFGIYSFLGFCSLVTQNSDGAYIALTGIYLILIWYAVKTYHSLVKFVEVLIINLAAFKFMGILQLTISSAFKTDTLSRKMSQSLETWILLAIVILFYLFLRFCLKKRDFNEKKMAIIPICIYILTLIGIVGIVILMVLVSNGKLPALEKVSYLKFTDLWGNKRGYKYVYSLKLYQGFDFFKKLFGAGPDCFYSAMYEVYKGAMDSYHPDGSYVSNAHSEELNQLVTVGLFGFGTYYAIFISSIKEGFKYAKKSPDLIAMSMIIAGYVMQSSFMYQTFCTTYIVFFALGFSRRLVAKARGDEFAKTR